MGTWTRETAQTRPYTAPGVDKMSRGSPFRFCLVEKVVLAAGPPAFHVVCGGGSMMFVESGAPSGPGVQLGVQEGR